MIAIAQAAGIVTGGLRGIGGVKNTQNIPFGGGLLGKTIGKTKVVDSVFVRGKGGGMMAELSNGTILTGSKASRALIKQGMRSFGGIATGLISGGLTAYNEFGRNNNHSTAKKVGRTAGATIGGIVGTGLGSLLTPILPVIGPAIGGAVGAELGK